MKKMFQVGTVTLSTLSENLLNTLQHYLIKTRIIYFFFVAKA